MLLLQMKQPALRCVRESRDKELTVPSMSLSHLPWKSLRWQFLSILGCAHSSLLLRSVDIQGTFEAKGVHNAKERLKFVAAEVREPFPASIRDAGIDTLVMKHFLSGFSDNDADVILKHCKQVLPAQGKILLLQTLVPEAGDRQHNVCRDGVAPGESPHRARQALGLSSLRVGVNIMMCWVTGEAFMRLSSAFCIAGRTALAISFLPLCWQPDMHAALSHVELSCCMRPRGVLKANCS